MSTGRNDRVPGFGPPTCGMSSENAPSKADGISLFRVSKVGKALSICEETFETGTMMYHV